MERPPSRVRVDGAVADVGVAGAGARTGGGVPDKLLCRGPCRHPVLLLRGIALSGGQGNVNRDRSNDRENSIRTGSSCDSSRFFDSIADGPSVESRYSRAPQSPRHPGFLRPQSCRHRTGHVAEHMARRRRAIESARRNPIGRRPLRQRTRSPTRTRKRALPVLTSKYCTMMSWRPHGSRKSECRGAADRRTLDGLVARRCFPRRHVFHDVTGQHRRLCLETVRIVVDAIPSIGDA